MKNSFWEYSTKFGLLVGAALILAGTIFFLRGYSINYSPTLIMVERLLVLVGILFGVRKYRDEIFQGKITYGKAFKMGLVISINAAILYGIFAYILCRFIDPNILQETINASELILKNMNYSEANIEYIMQMYRKITPSIYAISQCFSFIGLGLLLSLIVALFSRNNPFLQGKEY